MAMQISEANCPIPVDMLGQLYRAEPVKALDIVEDLPESQRIELALFCYGRAHLRPLAMSIAGTCDATKLVRNAGNVGEALAIQCRQGGLVPRARISLGGTRH